MLEKIKSSSFIFSVSYGRTKYNIIFERRGTRGLKLVKDFLLIFWISKNRKGFILMLNRLENRKEPSHQYTQSMLSKWVT